MVSQTAGSFRNSIWGKVTLVLVISLLFMIPVGQVEDLIRERHRYGEQAKNEVEQKWSKKQSTGAVVLSVPIVQKRTRKNQEGKKEVYFHNSHVHFLPEDLKIFAVTDNVIRHRGLYRIPLYETQLEVKGTFAKIKEHIQNLEDTRVLWDKAELNLGVDEVRGLKEVKVLWNGVALKPDVGNMRANVCTAAVKAAIAGDSALAAGGRSEFHVSLRIKGSEALEFLPFGETTEVKMSSNWGDPSFDGAFLPDRYDIAGNRFTSQWKVLGLNRNLPKYWVGGRTLKKEMDKARFGVKFLMPLETYQLNTRAVKYSFLFVALTFATMFFIEILFGLKFHPMHYTMTGAGLCLFYLLLLSLSEHLGFAAAYALAGTGTILSIVLYVLGVTRVKKGAGIVLVQLSVLYGFLYVLLQEEDFALVAGSIGLWLVLGLVMYVTRRIDWFNIHLLEGRTALRP